MAAGDYAGAAAALEQLAQAAEARGGPRAPFFHVQAGRARAMAGQPAEALRSMERGLQLFAARGQLGRVQGFGSRLLSELTQKGLGQESQELAAFLQNLSPGFSPTQGGQAPKRPPLPTHCPGCGAPVRPDEVEWLDEITAECAFCGSPVRAV